MKRWHLGAWPLTRSLAHLHGLVIMRNILNCKMLHKSGFPLVEKRGGGLPTSDFLAESTPSKFYIFEKYFSKKAFQGFQHALNNSTWSK